MNASDFDQPDRPDQLALGPDLTARLRAAAGAEPDLASAHVVLGRRVAGARRRRAAVVTGSAGLTVLLLGAVFVANTGGRGGRVTSADAPAVGSPTGTDASSTVVTATSLAPVVVTTEPVAPLGSSPATPSAPSTGSAETSSPSPSLDDLNDPAAGDDSGALFDVTAIISEVRTVSGTGGAIDVRLDNGEISFASFPVAASGFTAQVTRDETDRLEVTFTSATHRTRLRVRLDGARWRADRREEDTTLSSVPTNPAPHTTADDNDDDDHDSTGDDDDDGDHDSNGDSNDDSNDDSDDDSNDDQGGSSGSGKGGSGGSGDGSGGSGG